MENIQQADTQDRFDQVMEDAREYLKRQDWGVSVIHKLDALAFYPPNLYSDSDNLRKLHEARDRVLSYLESLMHEDVQDGQLLKVLERFYLFIEGFFERTPHKNAGIKKEDIEKIKMTNEYDVQHLLYAYLRPLYPGARTEVTEDTGYHTVRADIVLDQDIVVEVKCTRAGMSPRNLLEEIEADMVHYSASNLYFFIYDKEKKIENPLAFKESVEGKLEHKQVHIVIHQPKILP